MKMIVTWCGVAVVGAILGTIMPMGCGKSTSSDQGFIPRVRTPEELIVIELRGIREQMEQDRVARFVRGH